LRVTGFGERIYKNAEVGKNTSDCGFEKRKIFCDLGIGRAEEREYGNSEFGNRKLEKGKAHRAG
jgi:hypothetical protein